MKKAFEDNLPRLRPRVRLPGSSGELDAPAVDAHREIGSAKEGGSAGRRAEAAGPSIEGDAVGPAQPSVDVRAAVEAALRAAAEPEAAAPSARDPRRGVEPPPPEEDGFTGRRAEAEGRGIRGDEAAGIRHEPEGDLRRRKLRRKLASLTSVAPSLDPEGPRAAEEVLGAAQALSTELMSARERAERLEAELGRTRSDLDCAVAETERRRRDHDELAQRLDGARALLGELEAELAALEEERDEALHEVGALRAADAERTAGMSTLRTELDEARRQAAELRAERTEILAELGAEEAQTASLRREVSRLEGERARLAEQLAEASRARAALADSRKALEEVHRVLAVARAPGR